MGLQEGECRPWQTGWRWGQEWSHGQQGALSVPHGLLSPAELLVSLHRPALPRSLCREAQSSSRIQDGNLKAVPRVLHTRVPVSLRAPPSLPSGMS